MLSPWSALPDDFVLEDYLERYGAVLEARPAAYAGRWAQACYPLGCSDAASAVPAANPALAINAASGCGLASMADTVPASQPPSAAPAYREVRLDLGCGKGAFTVGSALREPDVLFIGMDTDPVCVAFAARLACENDARNALFLPGRDGTLEEAFAPGELDVLYLNFPTPHPKGREAAMRLTHAVRLAQYRRLLAEGGLLCLQTDNQPFYSYTLGQLSLAGYELLAVSEDARAELPPMPETAYERRAVEMGARIYAIHATPGKLPSDAVADARQAAAAPPASLYDYLPDDLDALGYIPPEMTRATTAIRRTRAQMLRKK